MRNGPKQRRTGAFVFRASPLDPGSVWVSPYGSNYAKVLAETLVQSGVNREFLEHGSAVRGTYICVRSSHSKTCGPAYRKERTDCSEDRY
jgi:hypothetical protein